MFHSASKLVKAPADLKGMKVRGPTRQVTKLLGSLGPHPSACRCRRFPCALQGHDRSLRHSVGSRSLGQGARAHQVPYRVPASTSLYTTTFVMAMNKAKYESLAPELKKVIDANSGMATSGWLGKTQQGNDDRPQGRGRPRQHDLHAHACGSAGVRQAVQPDQLRVGDRHQQARLRRHETAAERTRPDRQAHKG
jgi:hypothetical protein